MARLHLLRKWKRWTFPSGVYAYVMTPTVQSQQTAYCILVSSTNLSVHSGVFGEIQNVFGCISYIYFVFCQLQSTVASLHIPSAPPCALSWQDLDVVFMRQVWPVSSSRHVASRGKPPEVDRWLHTRPAASFCALNATQQQCGGHITTHYPQILWAVELLKGEGDVHIILGINCTTLHHTVPLPASRLKQGGGGSSISSVFHYKVVLFYLHPALTLICLTRLIKQKTSRSSCSQPIPASFTKRYNDPHMWASLRSYLSWSVRHLKIQNIFIF